MVLFQGSAFIAEWFEKVVEGAIILNNMIVLAQRS